MGLNNQTVVIVDYGMGNLGSIANMIRHIGFNSIITSNISEIQSAKKIILPGVGHFDKAMQNIKSANLTGIIKEKAFDEKIPVLGICLGMQIMCNASEEGTEQGLGLVNADVKKFTFQNESTLKIPHMGWNIVEQAKDNRLFSESLKPHRFYFVHSYYVNCNDKTDVLTFTNYGFNFTSAFQRKNIVGVQFHPEKSHKFGMDLLRNFITNF